MEWHPENDPSLHVSLPPELLESTADDPLHRLERATAQFWAAIAYVLGVPVITGIVFFLCALLAKERGGPLCDAGVAQWLCTRGSQIYCAVIPGAVAYAGIIVAMVICWRLYVKGERWQPWLAILWALIPFAMMWSFGMGTVAILGHS